MTVKSPRRLSAEDQKGLSLNYGQPKSSGPYHSSIETTTNILLNKDDYYQTSFVDTELVQASVDEAPTKQLDGKRTPKNVP